MSAEVKTINLSLHCLSFKELPARTFVLVYVSVDGTELAQLLLVNQCQTRNLRINADQPIYKHLSGLPDLMLWPSSPLG